MEPEQFALMLQIFKVLADETRLRILGMVSEQPCSVEELATRLQLKEPTVSHHLTRLKQAGLVSMERDQTSHLYRLVPDRLQSLSKEVLNLETVAAPDDAPDAPDAAQSWEQKVLKTFLVDGRLTQIPGTRKKREVILRWLLQHFEPERRYPEKEVNALLAAYHPDVATLRRELVGGGGLQRENQIYWRV